jgi:hypothetical protein
VGCGEGGALVIEFPCSAPHHHVAGSEEDLDEEEVHNKAYPEVVVLERNSHHFLQVLVDQHI